MLLDLDRGAAMRAGGLGAMAVFLAITIGTAG
jgi:hypothetical protein